MQKSRLKNWRQRQTNLFQSFICSIIQHSSVIHVYSSPYGLSTLVFILLRELTKNQPLWGRFSSSNVVHTSGIMTRAAGCTWKRWTLRSLCRTENRVCRKCEEMVQYLYAHLLIHVLYRQTTVCCRSIYWCVTARSSRPFAVDVVRDGPDARAISCSCPAHHIISKLTKEEMESVYISYSIDHRRGLLSICWAFVLCYTEPVSLLCCVSRADLYM